MTLQTDFLSDARREFRRTKSLADRALEQIDDAQFTAVLDRESNSLALIVKHLAGNLRSRWTDFLTTDGEKPDRDRDSEFELVAADTRASLMERWERGWATCIAAIESLAPDDLERIVRIRGEELTVAQAITRQFSHYGYHVGQIALLAKHFAGVNWKTLSVPRGKSKEFNSERASYLKSS